MRSIREEERSVIRVGDSMSWERLDDRVKSFIILERQLGLDQFTLNHLAKLLQHLSAVFSNMISSKCTSLLCGQEACQQMVNGDYLLSKRQKVNFFWSSI